MWIKFKSNGVSVTLETKSLETKSSLSVNSVLKLMMSLIVAY